MNSRRCICCGSDNIEKTTDIHFYCCDCESVFSESDARVHDKILRKQAMFETRESTMNDMLRGTISYIQGFGLNVSPSVEMDIKRGIGSGAPLEETFSKLSVLEVFAEDAGR